jgi:hypothetical protein
MQAIHDCHKALHKRGVARIATDIRVGTRTDREIQPGTGNKHKVERVRNILSLDETKLGDPSKFDRAEEVLASASALAQAKFI